MLQETGPVINDLSQTKKEFMLINLSSQEVADVLQKVRPPLPDPAMSLIYGGGTLSVFLAAKIS